MKMKRKRDKKIDLPRRGFEPRNLEQIPAQNLNFEGDQINGAHVLPVFCVIRSFPELS